LEKIALIPVYQPDENLYDIVQELKKLNFRIFVVNDGSYNEISKYVFDQISNDCEIIKLERNKGKGAALKAGLQRIKQLRLIDSNIVTLDADGQHLPGDADNVLKELHHSNADLVLGTRNFFDTKIPFRSLFGNIFTAYLLYGLKKKLLLDTQTGLRAFSYNQIDELLEIKGENYDWEFAVLNKFFNLNKKISTCVINTIYETGNPSSHFKKVSDSAKIYNIFIKYSFANIFAIGVEYFIFVSLLYFTSSILISLTVARITSLIFHFLSQKIFTFKNYQKFKLKQVFSYSIIAFFNFFISLTLLTTFEQYFNYTVVLKILIDLSLSFFTFILLLKLFSTNKK
jgi:putative flippase GtrA